MLRGCVQQQLLLTDNFKLCCQFVLPPPFDLNQCHARQADVSSCDDIVSCATYCGAMAVLATYCGAMAVLAILAVLGNLACLTGGVVLTHFSVADLGMGLYLATVELADRLVAGHYVWQDVSDHVARRGLEKGAVCQLTGVLANIQSLLHHHSLVRPLLTPPQCNSPVSCGCQGQGHLCGNLGS